jgi:hypothetical protein
MDGLERNLLGAPAEEHQKVEIYSGVARLSRTVWASEVRIAGTQPDVAVMLCHPTANFLGHYALAGLAERGLGGIGFTTRYVGNDTSLIMENCLTRPRPGTRRSWSRRVGDPTSPRQRCAPSTASSCSTPIRPGRR